MNRRNLLPSVSVTPAVMQWKGRLASGLVNRQPAGAVDLFPTLCRLAGTPHATHVGGRELIPMLFDLARDPRETNHLTGEAAALRKVRTAFEEVRATVPS